jgi:hypothetical protein
MRGILFSLTIILLSSRAFRLMARIAECLIRKNASGRK